MARPYLGRALFWKFMVCYLYEEEWKMKTEQQYFEQGRDLATYMEEMTTKKEQSFHVYEKFHVPADDDFIARLKQSNVHITAITEDWCGDAMMNNAILRRIAEAAGVEVHVVLRDEDTDLIDRYLTNGGRSIPKYLLMNESGEVIETWGPRADMVQDYAMDAKSKIPEKDAPDFEEQQKKIFQELTSQYENNTDFHMATYSSIREKWYPVLKG